MRILITGNAGYVGPVLVGHLRRSMPDAAVMGVDTGLFAHCLTTRRQLPEVGVHVQHHADVRDVSPALLEGVDAVVHLAAVSNDPMGNRFSAVTAEINRDASVRLALAARDAGVKHFVFASSCSVYGAGGDAPRTERDEVNPLTAYASSKVDTERALADADLGGLVVTCLRFATACGMAPRLRLDLVLNDFVASALATGEIVVLSDGSPWRPLIHVADMARAIEWAVRRPVSAGGPLLVVNAGSNEWNYRVSDLAEAVAAAVPGTTVSINRNAAPDKRSYRVDFSLFGALAPEHRPVVGLPAAIDGLVNGLREIGFANADFRNSPLMRLKTLEAHIGEGRLSEELRWKVFGA